MNLSHASCILKEAKELYAAELHDSVESLISLFISSYFTNPEPNPTSEVLNELYVVQGDAIYAKKEYRRALDAYLFAEQRGRGTLSSSAFKSKGSLVSSEYDASIRTKQAKCYAATNDNTNALKTIESIPLRYRSLSAHCLLGELYAELNLTNNAIQSYKEALQLSPMSIQVIGHLIELGVEMTELRVLIEEASNSDSEVQACLSSGWLHNIMQALYLKKSNEMRKSLIIQKDLNATFPRNLFLLGQTAECSMRVLGNDENSLLVFRHMNKVSKHYPHTMDDFASVLFSKEEEQELNRLATNLVEGCPHMPQTWVTAAYYSAVKKDFENALNFIDKAILLKPRYFNAYIAKGKFCVLMGSHDLAIVAFSQAHSIQKTLNSFSGLIESNIALGKYKEAANHSRECVKFFPKAAESFYMMGKVLSKSHNALGECVKAYAKALKYQPKYEAAAHGLASTLLAQNKVTEAIDCLQQTLQKISSPSLRLLFAKALSGAGKYQEAMEQLQVCTSLHGNVNGEVAKEMERIEGLLRAENGGAGYEMEGMEEYEEE